MPIDENDDARLEGLLETGNVSGLSGIWKYLGFRGRSTVETVATVFVLVGA